VEGDEAVESGGEAGAGEFEEVDVRLFEHFDLRSKKQEARSQKLCGKYSGVGRRNSNDEIRMTNQIRMIE
jgi:hypothetical protein